MTASAGGEPMLGGESHATSWQFTIVAMRSRHSAAHDPPGHGGELLPPCRAGQRRALVAALAGSSGGAGASHLGRAPTGVVARRPRTQPALGKRRIRRRSSDPSGAQVGELLVLQPAALGDGAHPFGCGPPRRYAIRPTRSAPRRGSWSRTASRCPVGQRRYPTGPSLVLCNATRLRASTGNETSQLTQ